MFRILALHFLPIQDDRLKWRSEGTADSQVQNELASAPTILTAMAPDTCDVERYGDGKVLVRVHSCDRNGRKLPDAVFTFRLGDPQYTYWVERSLPVGQCADGLMV